VFPPTDGFGLTLGDGLGVGDLVGDGLGDGLGEGDGLGDGLGSLQSERARVPFAPKVPV
jgi:hypothetical protein